MLLLVPTQKPGAAVRSAQLAGGTIRSLQPLLVLMLILSVFRSRGWSSVCKLWRRAMVEFTFVQRIAQGRPLASFPPAFEKTSRKKPETVMLLGPGSHFEVEGHHSVSDLAKRTLDVIKNKPRIWTSTYFVRLFLGFPPQGMVTGYGRSEATQKAKARLVRNLNARVESSLRDAGNQISALDWSVAQRNHTDPSTGLTDLIVDVSHAALKKMLKLPVDLDLRKLRDLLVVTNEVTNDADDAKYMILGLVGLQNMAAPKSNLREAQVYLKELLAFTEWDGNSFIGDCMAAGKACGCGKALLAEMLAGASYNPSNMVSIIVWLAVHGDPIKTECGQHELWDELRKACADCEDLSDYDVVYDRMPASQKAAEGRKVLHTWVTWVLLNFPSFQCVPRADLDTGKLAIVDIGETNKLMNWNTDYEDIAETSGSASFGRGRFACPGQSLARATMILTLRALFSPTSPVRRHAHGSMKTSYGGPLTELHVTWTDDSIPWKQDACKASSQF